VIDKLKSRFGEVGLTFPFNRVDVEEVEYLPEPAAFHEGKLFLLKSADKEQQFRSAVEAVALEVYTGMDDLAVTIWSNAFYKTNPAAVTLIREAVTGSVGYEEAVASLQSPIVRLIAIHLFNALIKSGTSYESAKGLDFSTWGGTTSLASGGTVFSLLPLLGAYAPARIYTYFPESIASLVCDRLSCVTHGEVRAAYADVLKSAFNG
jgi:hypothetical protein